MIARGDAGPVLVLGALVCGTLVGERAGGSSAWFALGAGTAALVAAWLAAGPARVVIAALAIAMLGSAAMQRAMDGLEYHTLAPVVAHGDDVRIQGVLVRDPDGQRFGASVLVRVDDIDRIILVKASGDAAGRLRVLQAGDRVDLNGWLEPLPIRGYDARARWEHAVALLTDAELRAFVPADGAPAQAANAVRDAILRGTEPLEPTPRALLAGFLLGDTRAIPGDIIDEYRASGLSHLLAVSGANVAFVLIVFAPLLRRLSLMPRTMLAIAVVMCFAAATRFEPSVLRAATLTTVTILAAFVGRPVSPVRALVGAIVVLLLADPFLLHSIGFHLSCAASGGIALFARPMAQRIRGPRLIREPLAVSIAAQCGVAPVLLTVFGSVPVVAPAANLLAFPAAEALGVFGLVASVAGGFVPVVGAVLAPITAALIAWVSGVAHLTAGRGGEIDGRTAILVVATGAIATLARRARRPVSDAASR